MPRCRQWKRYCISSGQMLSLIASRRKASLRFSYWYQTLWVKLAAEWRICFLCILPGSLCEEFSKLKKRHKWLFPAKLHEYSFWSTVTAGSDHYFRTSCPSVRPSPLFKISQNKTAQAKIMISTDEIVVWPSGSLMTRTSCAFLLLNW